MDENVGRRARPAPPPPALPPAAGGETTCLCDSPELPFNTRLALTMATYSLTASRLLLLLVLVCIVRVPQHHSELHAVFRCYLAAVVGELLWRRACRRSPHGGSYARWRHLALPVFALCDVFMSRFHVVLAGLNITTPIPSGGWRDGLHHLLLLLLSSRFMSNLFLWALCHRAMYMLPAQLAVVYHHWLANADSCSAAVLAAPSALPHTHRAAGTLASLQLGGLPNELLHRQLTPIEECRTVLAWQQLLLGLALPLVAQLSIESRLYTCKACDKEQRPHEMAGQEPPHTYKALVCEKLGQPTEPLGHPHGALRLQQLPAPPLTHPNAVRIRVAAASLNFADALQLQGQYQEKPKLPFVPGSECSGTVVECGRDVRTLKVGDKVCAVTQGGAFAEEVVVRENVVVKLPDSADVEGAAGLLITYGTAWLALRERADLRPGQTILVLGAAGGVGLAAVQLARTMGARVIAVARGHDKMAALKQAGADECIDMAHHKPEQLKSLLRQSASQGVDVIFDPVGGSLLMESLKTARWGAHILIIGFASGTIPKLPANLLLVKNLTAHGIYWGSYMQKEPRVFRKSLDEVVRLFTAGAVRPQTSHRFALEEAPDAFRVLLNRQVIGKILLLPQPRPMELRSKM
ncbi:quinone oxidoreductase 2-like protein isoform A [Chlorella sorokiniana]|uniref:Quinone oxidoreductase 2-like protein isoform A n=1 Tax=Chlorella sorokiniana TaxID=3076 RepID=A0A2P6TGH2_CHLSO|nr:quinone oxidoreductase 2-like protein isoform A [Chlorella sorokiniana]|eukprot:PRW33214.1 quinone oxidoreductase 2-like protein isoform A [Chlorella sorokiniana]